MPKTPTSTRQSLRHNPLSEDYAPTTFKQKRAKRKSSDENAQDAFVDSKASKKILQIGQELAEEDRLEREARRPAPPNPAFAFDSRFEDGVVSDDEDPAAYDDDTWGDEEEEVVEEVEIDPNDLELFNRFNPSLDPSSLFDTNAGEPQQPGTNLADLILEKIAQHEAAQNQPDNILGGGPPEDAVEIPAKVVEVYTQVGLILSRYKSGKLPKPFKILPTLPQWETLVAITRPDDWTPHACYAATRLFVSAPGPVAQIFLNTILLPHFRAECAETKRKLNVHLWNAVKKSLYKPAAFFKGFMLPLVRSGTCTQLEARVLSSVLRRVHIPVLHSAAALHALCDIAAEQMARSPAAAGPANILIRTLLEKKYALPYKVVDALVFHFLRFKNAPEDAEMGGTNSGSGADEKLPVLWHQCLLAFAQRYRNDITEDQREALLDLLLVREHKAIGPEVRRELLEGRGRGVPLEQPVGDGGDDTMVME